jgi:putative transposase
MIHANNCVYALHYHLVLVTKRRRPVLTGPMLEAAEAAIRERCALRGGHLEEFGAEAEHVHALVSLPPAATLAEFVNAVKTTTSRRLRRDFPQLRRLGDALWSPSYFIASAGGAPLDRIQATSPEAMRDGSTGVSCAICAKHPLIKAYVRAPDRPD